MKHMAVVAAWTSLDPSDPYAEHLEMQPADPPEGAELHEVNRGADAFTMTTEDLELLLWVARPHTAEDW